ncbi:MULTISPECIES: MFS transporter [Amycolatopsis]|uniref:MFS transporter n=1 Tax=Amycolatopsis TaxID=1813 RepID=UPI001E45EA35|nr:MFS transporter [Amycolatopsis thermoflava]
MQPPEAPVRAAELGLGRAIAVLTVLVFVTEVVALSFQLVTPALTEMSAVFQTAQIGWVVTILSLVGAIAVPLAGKSADIRGKKKVMVWLTAAMIVGSIVVALAPTFGVVLAGRALQGLMIAAGPLTYSLMRDVMPGRMLALGASISTTGIGLVTVAGPFLSGFLIDHFGFRGVFWFLAGLGALALVALLVLVPESPLRLPARLDVLGGVLLGGAVALLLLGLTFGPEHGWGSLAALLPLLGGVLAGVLWWWHQRRGDEPLVDLRVVRARPVWTVMVAGAAVMTAVTAAAVLIPLMVQTPRALAGSYGFDATASDVPLYLVPAGVATMLGGFAIGALARKLGPHRLLVLGATLMAVGSVALAFLHGEPWQVVTGYLISGAGSGLAMGAVPNLVIAAVPPDQQGVTAGVVSLLQSLGSSAGVQIIFIVLALQVVAVAGGQPIYAGSSYTIAFILVAALSLVAVVAVLAAGTRRKAHEEGQ